MIIKTIMSHPVITVTEETTIREALEILEKNNIRRLPVVDGNNKLVGLANEWYIRKVFPEQSNTFEYNLISRTPIKNVMQKEPLTVNPEETIENAAVVMQCNHIGCLPVIVNDEVVGLISHTDILKAFIEALGLDEDSVRITIKYSKRMGFLADLIQLVDKFGIVINNMVTFHDELVIRIGIEKSEQLLKILKEENYNISHIAHIYGTGDSCKVNF